MVLGFNSADQRQIALDLMEKNTLTFPCILDSSQQARKTTSAAYHGSAVPTTYVVGRDGKIVDAWIGYEKGDRRVTGVLKKLGIE